MTISVIIPAYNSAAFLAQTLDSLLAQKLQAWEAVVVDDGSTDNTGDILARYCEKDSRIRCIKQKNAGVSAARNRGLEEATGDYVVFLDADDLYEPDALCAFAEAAKRSGADIILGRLRFFENGKKGAFHAAADTLAACGTIETFDKRLLWNFLVCNKCYRRSLLNEQSVRFPASGFSEEGAFFMDAVYTGARMAGTTKSVALYRRHTAQEGASVSQTANEKNLQSLEVSMRHIYDAAVIALQKAEKQDEDYLQEILYKHLHILASQFYRALWHMPADAAALCAEQMRALLPRLDEAHIALLCGQHPDLNLTAPCATKAEAAAHPTVSVAVSRRCSPQAAAALLAQTCPLFELLLTPRAAKGLPALLFSMPNVHVDETPSPAGGKVLRLRKLPELDPGALQTLFRVGPLPAGLAVRAVNLLLKRRHKT